MPQRTGVSFRKPNTGGKAKGKERRLLTLGVREKEQRLMYWVLYQGSHCVVYKYFASFTLLCIVDIMYCMYGK